MKTEIATIQVRLATPEDLKKLVFIENKKTYMLNFGLPYLLKSMITKEFEGWYQISEHTDANDIAEWLKNDMIYVALKPFEK